MSSVKLDWASAEVEDARLTVPLDGELAKGWRHTFERTATLLGDGEWGEVKLKKGNVHVSDVTAGSEEKLRHHLEAIVAQANESHKTPDDKAEDADDDADSENVGESPGPDAEMTERFRAFAEG